MANTTGCWTCRLRHVKCDEALVACLQCTSRRLCCHGYGPKPSWMDGGEGERRERQLVKKAVKKNLKRRRATHVRDSESFLSPEGYRVQNTENVETMEVKRITPTSPNVSRRAAQTQINPIPEIDALTDTSFLKPLLYDEANLLMYYLDHVFPLQYPYYSTRKQSRGWLLWLMSRNGPLYRVSLCLAALHQRASLGQNECTDLELEFHSRALRELQGFIASFGNPDSAPADENVVEILACGLALISFEVIKGSSNGWQTHLYAMVAMSKSVQGNFTYSSIQNPPVHLDRKIAAPIIFHISVLLWIDILACISTGTKPSLPYEEWLASNTDIDLSLIMGCHNWVMKAIGDLEVLKDWTTTAAAGGQLCLDEFERKRQCIEDDLEDGLDTAPMPSPEVTKLRSS